MKRRDLAIVCHNALRPMYKSHNPDDERANKWGKQSLEYKTDLRTLVNLNIEKCAPCLQDATPVEHVRCDIVAAIVKHNPHPLEQ